MKVKSESEVAHVNNVSVKQILTELQEEIDKSKAMIGKPVTPWRIYHPPPRNPEGCGRGHFPSAWKEELKLVEY